MKAPRRLADKPAPRDGTMPPFPVVGIGASAGGLEAATQLLRDVPVGIGMAFIVVQHLAPHHDSLLPELLASASQLPVVAAVHGAALRPDHVYVIPPDVILRVNRGTLELSARPQDRQNYMPIDIFLRSLGAYARSQAVAVILSGTASDGALGVRDVNAAGGIVIAQKPESARYDGMPRAAIATGTVDMVLSPPEIAAELTRLGRHAYLRRPRDVDEEVTLDDGNLNRLFAILRSATGVDFGLYKPPTIRRRLQRRMAAQKIAGLEKYVEHLEKNPAEVNALYQDILIHVTHFFREPEAFESLARHVFPKITKAAPPDQPIRIWTPGCSTGEEAYSVAMALLEYLGDRAGSVAIQVFATDVSEAAVEQARGGVYPDSVATDLSPERLRRFFTKLEGKYRINKSVRDLCVFSRQDLSRDPPFSRLDLVVCRNVLIYFGQPLQKRLIGVFHYALKPSGYLLLGGAETVGLHVDLFGVVDKKCRLYRKKHVSTPPAISFTPGHRGKPMVGKLASEPRAVELLQAEADRVILAHHSPPGMVVDADFQVLQFRGHVGEFLHPSPGQASLNLLKLVRDDLVPRLRFAVQESRKKNHAVKSEPARVDMPDRVHEVTVEVVPLGARDGESRHFLILFHDSPPAPAESRAANPSRRGGRSASPPPAPPESQQLRRLRQELNASRDHLRSNIQDLESANEELQSANEEVLSANEELQSTNEELDTAKEELQSTNEELNTVNEELHGRNEELMQANSDLLNLINSVQVAIIIVTSDLRIRRFTPMAEKVLNLLPGDVGRPISHIKPEIDCPDLDKLIVEAMDRITHVEREVKDRQNRWYSLRVFPYKNLENKIDGAVLVLFDVTSVRHQTAVRQARDYAQALVQTVREPLVVLDTDLRIRTVNKAFLKTFGVRAEESEGLLLYELGNGQWDIPQLRGALDEVVTAKRALEDFAVDHDFPQIGHKRMLLNARRVLQAADQPELILLAIEDVTDKGAAHS